MKLNKKGIISIVTLLGVLLFGIFILNKEPELPIETRAYVVEDRVVETMPEYQEYLATKQKLANLFAQRKVENKYAKDETDSSASYATWANDGFTAEKLAVKKQMLRINLKRRYNEYVRKLAGTVYSEPTAADLKIVNLQLELLGLELENAEKVEKQKELEELLVNRTPSLRAKDQALMSAVMRCMREEQKDAQNDFAEYKDSLKNEKNSYGILLSQSSEQDEIIELENLLAKQKAIYIDKLNKDIEAVAKEKNLQIVQGKVTDKILAKDITKDVIDYIEIHRK